MWSALATLAPTSKNSAAMPVTSTRLTAEPSLRRLLKQDAYTKATAMSKEPASCVGDSEGGQGSVWVAGVAAQRGGEVDRPGPAEHADDQVAQAGHDLGPPSGADLGGVLGEGDIAEVVQRLDGPVPAQQVGQPGRAGLVEAEAGDRVTITSRRRGPAARRLAGDLEDLGGMGNPKRRDA